MNETAYYLRSPTESMAEDADEIPTPLTDETLSRGQHVVPPELKEFFYELYRARTETSQRDKLERLAKCSCDYVVFNVTRGRIKPGKHICMGIALNSLTESRRVIKIMNRFGYSIGYRTVEALETQMASEICERQLTTPDGINRKPGPLTSLPWEKHRNTLWIRSTP